jgi:hypothetical protein
MDQPRFYRVIYCFDTYVLKRRHQSFDLVKRLTTMGKGLIQEWF